MVLEVLVNPKKGSGKKWEIFVIGVVYSLLGFVLSYWVFRSYAGLVMVTFAALASVPFVRTIIQMDEEKEEKLSGLPLFKEHSRTIELFTILFLGYVFVFTLLYVILPSSIVSEVFSPQNQAINTVREMVHSSPTGSFVSFSTLGKILVNNFTVLFFCLLFSLLYGMGAIFILSWNASVMGAAVGHTIKIGKTGFQGLLQSMGYFLHGIPEIMAYFVASLAGGILSIALVKGGIKDAIFRKTMKDSLLLIGLSVGILLIAGVIEVFLSPLVFY